MKRNYGSYLITRNGIFYLLYTVPRHAIELTRSGKSKQIWISLRTRDRKVAEVRCGIELGKLVAMYENSTNDNEPLTYDLMKTGGLKLGFVYAPASLLPSIQTQDSVAATSPMLEPYERLSRPTREQVAMMGGVLDVPALTFRQAFARFKEIMPDKVKNMSPQAARAKWRRYELKIDEFIKVIGDVDVLTLPVAKVNDFRAHLYRRHDSGTLKTKEANQYMEHIRYILRTVLKEYPGSVNPFENFDRFTTKDEGKREPFNEDDVRAIRNALPTSKLSEEERAVALVAQNTGAGVKELAFLAPDDIILDGKTPHLKIRPNAYRKYLKADDRERDLPLTGASLEAMRRFPNGFPTIRSEKGMKDANDHYSDFFRSVTPGKTFSGYRHRIASLLRKSKYNTEYQNNILGHSSAGLQGHYGEKIPVEDLSKAMNKILPKDNR